MNKHDKEITDQYGESPVVKNHGYSKRLLDQLICPNCGKPMFNDNRGCVCGYDPLAPETKNSDKPYLITIEVRASRLSEAIGMAYRMAGADGIMMGDPVSVIQKHRMTNVGTEWWNPELK